MIRIWPTNREKLCFYSSGDNNDNSDNNAYKISFIVFNYFALLCRFLSFIVKKNLIYK